MFKQASLAGLALLAAHVGASPVPQATISIVAPPPGMVPNATYVALGTGTAGATFVAERVATVSGVATTVVDAIQANPTNLVIVEADQTGGIIQAVNCAVSGDVDVCKGAVITNGSTMAYMLSATGVSTTVVGEGLTALPPGIVGALGPLAGNAYAFSSSVASIAPSTVTALPGFVGQNLTMNGTANATMSMDMSMSMSMATAMASSSTA